MSKKFIIFLIIVLGAVALWYWRTNRYSKEILKLEILGPEEVEITESFEYIVKYKNNGNVRLEEPRIIFEYPEYSIVDDNLLRKEMKLEDIYPGEERTHTFKARLFGKEGEAREAKVTLSYRPKNLKARYERATTFTTIIKTVPLTFRLDLPSKIESGKEIKFALNYFSNIDYPLSNLRAKIEYPPGFEFITSEPQSLEKVEWELPPLNKAEGGRIEIKGKIIGEVGEQKIFRADFGSWQEGEFVLLKEIIRGIEVIKPHLYISQQVNASPEYIASPGDLLHYEIFFKNIGESPLTDLSLFATLIGKSFNLETLKAPRGDYKIGDNSIVWDWKKIGELQFLDVQEEGKVDFWVQLKDEWEIPSSQGEETIKTRIYLSQAREEFENKVNSRLGIVQRGYFEDEVFGNLGYIPPKVGETTTYTIMWQVQNYYNNVNNVKVRAKLAKNVKLTGEIFPEDQTPKFTFDSESKEIVWEVGDLKVGSGALNQAPNISFQVALTPDVSQIGEAPTIIRTAEVTGEDAWTKSILKAEAGEIATSLPDDPTITEEMGIVQ
jgi:hypothetical protein